MVKRALLVGINYPGTTVELRGCVNDVHRMQECLIQRFRFPDENITMLIDTDASYTQPTGNNIRLALWDLIKPAKSGDILVFHYSGHGTRSLPKNGKYDATGFDECITPCDMDLIIDDEFREMVSKVPPGCKLTIISDSCHSGGLIEKAKEQIGESNTNLKKPSKFKLTTFLYTIFMNILSNCAQNQENQKNQENQENKKNQENQENWTELENGEIVDTKAKYIPLNSYITLLKEQTGESNINIENIRPTLVKIFGKESSPNVMDRVKEEKNHKGLLSMMFGECSGSFSGSTNGPIPENGILVSGCQTDQRSEDVYVVDSGKAYGAFSNAIQMILSKRRGQISNRDMVLRVREVLKNQKFSQRPGLYCHDRYVDEPFIC